MDDEIGTSVVCLAVLGVGTQRSAEVMARAQAVNAAKFAFKGICAPLQNVRTRVPVKGTSASSTKAIPVIRAILRSIQRSDLNLLAAYRKIPILDAPPATITYTRANTRSVYRKSVDEIYDLLTTLDTPQAIADRAQLATLDRHETHLALVKER
jgi:hypothetical protein